MILNPEINLNNGMIRLLLAIFFLLYTSYASANNTECVVLLHGWARSAKCMNPIEKSLQKAGYRTINISYPSRQYSIDELSSKHIHPLINTEGCSKVHFVAHSMGGLVTRRYLANYPVKNLGRVIFIASPNQGSEIVQKLSTISWISKILGPGCLELAKGSPMLATLAKPHYEFGIISADVSINPITSLFFLPGPDDGTITVESSLLDNMNDHIVISSTHTLVLQHDLTHRQIKHFLEYGKFKKKNTHSQHSKL